MLRSLTSTRRPQIKWRRTTQTSRLSTGCYSTQISMMIPSQPLRARQTLRQDVLRTVRQRWTMQTIYSRDQPSKASISTMKAWVVGNNLLALTEAFAQVREKLGVKISFTKGISNCASPKVLNTVFDYCLGQSYTDDTANLYAQTSCRRVNTAALWDAWNQKNPFIEGGYSVPTLCAGGNCQGDMPGFLVSRGGPCNIDERLDTTGIAEVIQSVDMEKIPNLAHFGGRPPCARWAGRDRRAVGMGFQPGRGFALPSTCLVAGANVVTLKSGKKKNK